jgi:hypothetical protein
MAERVDVTSHVVYPTLTIPLSEGEWSLAYSTFLTTDHDARDANTITFAQPGTTNRESTMATIRQQVRDADLPPVPN